LHYRFNKRKKLHKNTTKKWQIELIQNQNKVIVPAAKMTKEPCSEVIMGLTDDVKRLEKRRYFYLF
jgi:hypothetical protein